MTLRCKFDKQKNFWHMCWSWWNKISIFISWHSINSHLTVDCVVKNLDLILTPRRIFINISKHRKKAKTQKRAIFMSHTKKFLWLHKNWDEHWHWKLFHFCPPLHLSLSRMKRHYIKKELSLEVPNDDYVDEMLRLHSERAMLIRMRTEAKRNLLLLRSSSLSGDEVISFISLAPLAVVAISCDLKNFMRQRF